MEKKPLEWKLDPGPPPGWSPDGVAARLMVEADDAMTAFPPDAPSAYRRRINWWAVAGLTAFALLMAVLFWVGWFPASAVG